MHVCAPLSKKMRTYVVVDDDDDDESTDCSSTDSDSTYQSSCSSSVGEREVDDLPQVKLESDLPPKKRTYPAPIEVVDLVSDSEDEEKESGVRLRSASRWTEIEDALLRHSVAFDKIPSVPGRTTKACQTRRVRLNKPGPILSSGSPWSQEEDEMIKRFGSNVVLPGRSYAAIGKRQTIVSR